MATVEEIAKKIIEDDEYRDFLINGVPQKYKLNDKARYIRKYDPNSNYEIVKEGSTIAETSMHCEPIAATVKGIVVYNFMDSQKHKLKSPHFATIHHEDYKLYLDNKQKVEKSSMEKYNCLFNGKAFLSSKDSKSSFAVSNPSVKFNIDNVTLSVEKITNTSELHTGELKIAIRFSEEKPDGKSITGTKLVEFNLDKALKPGDSISDIEKKGKIQNDPDSGVYVVGVEVYEHAEDDSWILKNWTKYIDNFEWKSRKQFIAEQLISNPMYIETGTEDERSFYDDNKEAIEKLKIKIQNQISENNKQQAEADYADRKKNIAIDSARSTFLELTKTLTDYIDSFDIRLAGEDMSDMEILRNIRTIDETLLAITKLKDTLGEEIKSAYRNKDYVSGILDRYKKKDNCNIAACDRLEKLIQLFDELN